jgi:hypothetical protein
MSKSKEDVLASYRGRYPNLVSGANISHISPSFAIQFADRTTALVDELLNFYDDYEIKKVKPRRSKTRDPLDRDPEVGRTNMIKYMDEITKVLDRIFDKAESGRLHQIREDLERGESLTNRVRRSYTYALDAQEYNKLRAKFWKSPATKRSIAAVDLGCRVGESFFKRWSLEDAALGSSTLPVQDLLVSVGEENVRERLGIQEASAASAAAPAVNGLPGPSMPGYRDPALNLEEEEIKFVFPEVTSPLGAGLVSVHASALLAGGKLRDPLELR